MNLALLARYPFLPEAAAYIEDEGPALEELLTERVYAGARLRGRGRLHAALDAAELPVPELSEASSPRDLLEELLSYVYARILVSALKDAYAVRRHALAEAVRARELLLRERDGATLALAAGAVGLAFQQDAPGGAHEGPRFVAHFTEYLRHSVHLKDLEWKLVRQPVAGGEVRMDARTASRLVQEALRRKVEGDLPRPLPEEVVAAVEADLAPLREALKERHDKLQAEQFGEVDLALMPPCMKHILAQLQHGENAAHSARFAITSFLHAIGMGSEDIMRLFAQAPDFREDLTRYQVEHITGVTSGTAYTPPSCQAMQTFGICYDPDETCRSRKRDDTPRVVHPLSYYRYKVWLKQNGRLPAPPPPPPSG